MLNESETRYLNQYYRGDQPIWGKVKSVRPEINNIVVENRANEITAFKTGYLIGEPLQYIGKNGKSEEIDVLNRYMFLEDKDDKDRELVDDQHISGTGYRMVLPNKQHTVDDAPFSIYTLNPEKTFAVYTTALGNRNVLSGIIIPQETGENIYYCYTDKLYFEIQNRQVRVKPNVLGMNPIVEYPANTFRLGAFEIVIPILDAMNTIASNRTDSVEQFVQSLMVFKNCDIDSDDYQKLREEGAIKIKSDNMAPADVEILVQELNQMQTQELVDYMYQTVLDICGMPNRNGGSSTSDTGSAVIMRDGRQSAEARAKDSEKIFTRSEKQFLRRVLKILREKTNMNLMLGDIDIKFTRRNYENLLGKAQVLTMLLAQAKVHPRLAFTHCGLFTDAESAYLQSMEYYDKNKENAAAEVISEGATGNPMQLLQSTAGEN